MPDYIDIISSTPPQAIEIINNTTVEAIEIAGSGSGEGGGQSETDPIYEAEKINYYNKDQIISLFADLAASEANETINGGYF